MTQKRKRFIAGAICPVCKQQDTIMVYFEQEIEQIACVACDYHDRRPEAVKEKGSVDDQQLIGLFKPE
jgi:uncharacterized metal-binding protein (TIGR02443 family)